MSFSSEPRLSFSTEEEFLTGREALKAVSQPDGCWNWALVGPNPETLPLEGGGSGSVDEMRDCLAKQTHANAYGLLRLTFGTGRLARVKYVFVCASNVDSDFNARRSQRNKGFTLMQRGQAAAMRPQMEKTLSGFANCTASIEVTEVADLTVHRVIERVRQVSTIDSDVITVSQFQEAEKRAKEMAEDRKRRKAELQELAAAAQRARAEAKAEQERKEREEAERLRLEAEQKEREEAEKREREEAERRAREEAERKRREEEERRLREEAERLAAEEAERKAREEAERVAREEAERLAREEAERREREEEERRAREEAERREREEAARRAREEAERKQREEEEKRAREEAERRAQEEAKRKAREEALRKLKEEAERREREEAERKAMGGEETLMREYLARLAKEEAERRAREEAERRAREEAERKAREEAARRRDAAELALRKAVGSRDIDSIAETLAAAREAGVAAAVLGEAEEFLRTFRGLKVEIEEAIQSCSYGLMPTLLRRAESLGLMGWPQVRDMDTIFGGLRKYSFDLDFPPEGAVGPWGSGIWPLNPMLYLQLPGGHTANVSLAMYDLRGDPKFGFHIVSNPAGIPASCPAVVPGGAVLAEAALGADGFATGKVRLAGGAMAFCVPSLKKASLLGGRARVDVFSPLELTCGVIPEPKWEFQTSVQWEWSLAMKSAGGARGRPTWLQNPQLRVYLDQFIQQGDPVCVLAILQAVAGGPRSVAIHAVRNRRTMSYNVHAAVVAHSHEVMATPQAAYQDPESILCFEVTKDDLVVNGSDSLTPPFYLLPSAEFDCEEGAFEIHLYSTAALRCERVSARPKGAQSLQPPKEVQVPSSPSNRRAPGDVTPTSPATPQSARVPMKLRMPDPAAAERAQVAAVAASVTAAATAAASEAMSARSATGGARAGQRFAPQSRWRTATPPGTERDGAASVPMPGAASVPLPRSPRRRVSSDVSLASLALPEVGARVRVSDKATKGEGVQEATVCFVGPTSFATGFWIGLTLDHPAGKNDGSVAGKRYFDCQPQYGLFVRPEAVRPVPEPT